MTVCIADAHSFGPFPNIRIVASESECRLSPKLEFLLVSEINKPTALQQAPDAAPNCHFVKFNRDHLAPLLSAKHIGAKD